MLSFASRSCWVLLLSVAVAIGAQAAPVLLISIDGLHPDYVLKAEQHGLKVPRLRSFVREGTYATGVVGVVPTVTYPSHTTIITGLLPAQHGIHANTPFDPTNVNKDGWYWYAEDLQATTLFNAAKRAGMTTASVNWPVTVGDLSIDFLLPEYWRASTAEDLKVMRALSRPEGVMQSLEKSLGNFADGYVDTVKSDQIRTRFAVQLLRDHKPGFAAVHLIALDGIEHRHGPYVDPVYEVMESTDAMIGELVDAALAANPETVIAIVSDHGFFATHTAVNLRAAFVDAGLIRLKQPLALFAAPTVESWDAQVWLAGGSAAIVLRDTGDANTRQRVEQLLLALSADDRHGIARVLDRAEIAELGAFPTADFLVEFAPGFYGGNALTGDLLTPATSKGTHGYLPRRPEMHAAFFVKGRGIAPQRDLGVIQMTQIAPSLARILEVNWSNNAGSPLSLTVK